jgi:hypothetical protein
MSTKKGDIITYTLPNESPEAFEYFLHIIYNDAAHEIIVPSVEDKERILVETYIAGEQFGVNKVKNTIIDDLERHRLKNKGISDMLVKQVYEGTDAGSGLRRWYIDRISLLDVSNFDKYRKAWPTDAVVDLAITLKTQTAPSSKSKDMSRYYDLDRPGASCTRLPKSWRTTP